MRKIVAYELLSLDGVAEDPDDFIDTFDEVMIENLRRVIATQDTVLFGRRTYDEWSAFWPSSDIEPFASFVNNVQKFVVTSSPLRHQWNNSSVVEGDLASFVRTLRASSGGDVGLHGSITLVQALLQEQLIDELRLVIFPVLQVEGRKLFDHGPSRRLNYETSVVSPSGSLLVDFSFVDR